LTVNASESITLIGTKDPQDFVTTAIFVQTSVDSSGKGGNAFFNTARFLIRDGAGIGVGTTGSGDAGELTINASESVEILETGVSSPSLLSSATAQGLFRIPSDISEAEPAPPQVSSGQLGKAGKIIINTRRLTLQDGGQIQAFTADGEFADIQAFGGNGGNITINATESVQVTGVGTVFDINDRGELKNPRDISSSIVTSTGFADALLTGSGNGGDIEIHTPHLRVANQGTILVNSFDSTGEAGSLRINAGSISLDNNARFVADSTSGSGGNIILNATEFLSLRHNSSISATAGNNGDGGNILITTPFIFAVPQENSDISANANLGSGGNITITASGLFGLEFRPWVTPLSDITVSSTFSQSGTFTLTRLDGDPQSELIIAPTEVLDTDNALVRICGAGGRLARGTFIITGRGGLPTDPDRSLDIREGLVDFGDRGEDFSALPVSVPANISLNSPDPIVEAQGWIISSNGDIILTDRASEGTPHRSDLTEGNCHLGENRS
jgi:large exoprotein involved in heme utilization and adhesion